MRGEGCAHRTDTHTRCTDTQTHRHTDTHAHAHTHTHTHTHTQTRRHTPRSVGDVETPPVRSALLFFTSSFPFSPVCPPSPYHSLLLLLTLVQCMERGATQRGGKRRFQRSQPVPPLFLTIPAHSKILQGETVNSCSLFLLTGSPLVFLTVRRKSTRKA